MGKVENKFKELKKQGKSAFIAYVPYGFPYPKLTKEIFCSLQDGGVDLIELGVPFSDPLADGSILQEACKVALEKGANMDGVFKFLNDFKPHSKVPIVIMTYYNPIYSYGVDKFLKDAKKSGVSGIMVVDLPIEEADCFIKKARKLDLDTIFFVTPTTSSLRIKKILNACRGFVYYVSITGITGPNDMKLGSIVSDISKLKKKSSKPVCVGFGIHTKSQVKSLSKVSDGVIVGSEITKYIRDNHMKKSFLSKFRAFIKDLHV